MSDEDFKQHVGCFCFVLFAVVFVVVLIVKMGGGAGHNYSTGERVGTLQKFSVKGMVWKSGEGELRLSGAVLVDHDSEGRMTSRADAWEFSAIDPGVQAQAFKLAGRKVRVFYRQSLIAPIEQATAYTATSIEPVE